VNRRNVINANTDQSRSSGARRSGSFTPAFVPTDRDLGLHVPAKVEGKVPLTQGSGNEKDP
jgi:hypothetical protein